eukprot:393314_1
MAINCCNEDDTNKLRTELKSCKTEISILRHKNSVLTDLFEEHKAKYNQMVLYYEQKEEGLQSQFQEKIEELRLDIDCQESAFIAQTNKTNASMREYAQYMQQHLQIVRSLHSQMNHLHTQRNRQQQDIMVLREQLQLANDIVRQKDESIAHLQALRDYFYMQSELPLSLNRQQTVKISEPSSKRQKSSSVNSEYLSFCVEHMKATSMESDDADIYSTSKSQTLLAMRNVYNLSSSVVTIKSRRVSLDSNETDNDDKRYKGIVPPTSLSSIISDDSLCETDDEPTCV